MHTCDEVQFRCPKCNYSVFVRPPSGGFIQRTLNPAQVPCEFARQVEGQEESCASCGGVFYVRTTRKLIGLVEMELISRGWGEEPMNTHV